MLNNKIKVYARIKPSSDSRRHHCEIKVNRTDKKKLLLLYRDFERNPMNLQPMKLHDCEEFLFENIFTESASQESIYNSMAKPVVERAIEGYNGTIMAYGQTGTGKTHTICGGPDMSMKGIIPRAFKHVFYRMKEMKLTNFKMYLSAMEIYNDHAFDLLSEKITKFGLPRVNSKQIIPRNLKMVQVSSMHDLGKLLKRASSNRVVRNTGMNDASSRSHCIFSLHLYQYQNNSSCSVKSKIHMIDLSGSEKIGKKRPSGIIFNESRHINLSLHYIELVIRALSDKNQDHIPYRNSMITSFLRDSLGGNSNTVMIFTLSLDPKFFEETVLTCRFAQRVSLISNKMQNIHKSHSTDSKKNWKTDMIRRSKHKGINCKLDWSDSSLSVHRDDSDELVNMEEIANLKNELEESKKMVAELSAQLLSLKNEGTSIKTQSTPLINGYHSNILENEKFNREIHNTLPMIYMEPSEEECLNSLTKPFPQHYINKTEEILDEGDGLIQETNLCPLCGKRLQNKPRNNTVHKFHSPLGQESEILEELHHLLKMKCKVKLLKNKELKSFINKILEKEELFLLTKSSLEKQTEAKKILVEVTNSLKTLIAHSKLNRGESFSVCKSEMGSTPISYFIYELIGLSLPSKHLDTGKPYENGDIEKYCDFLAQNLNIKKFKKKYYEKHCEFVEKEFQGCYKLNKKILSLEKLKTKLNEMKSSVTAGLEEKDFLEKLIKTEEKKIDHGKVMLEIIRNERLEILKCVKRLRNSLLNQFHHECLENKESIEDINENHGSLNVKYTKNKLHEIKNDWSKDTKSDEMENVHDSEKTNEVVNKTAKISVKSMPDLSEPNPIDLNSESRYQSTRFRIISRSDTIINSYRLPITTQSNSSDESRISSSTIVNEKTKLISSEESYISYTSEINTMDPSSEISPA